MGGIACFVDSTLRARAAHGPSSKLGFFILIGAPLVAEHTETAMVQEV